FGEPGSVADVVLIHAPRAVCAAPPAGRVAKVAQTSQSPAVSDTEPISAATVDVSATAEPETTVVLINSPTSPAGAAVAAAMPGIEPATLARSALASARHVGLAAAPVAGPISSKLAD